MGNNLDKETLTYEKLQDIIDTQLAHIEEIQTTEENKDETKLPNSSIIRPKNQFKLSSYWEKLKGIFSSIL